MWRRSLQNLASHPNPHPSSLFLLLRTTVTRSTSTTASPANSVRKDSAIPATSASALDLSSSAAASVIKAKDVVDFGKHYGRCYWELSKARLSMLVVATSGTGFVLGSGSSIDYMGLCCTCAGTMMVAAAANSLNQVFEVKNDALMKRTRLRPLPSGRMSIPHAVAFASSVGVAGTALLACEANALAAGLAASNLILYSFIYTPLKQIHPVNTWVGAIVGAIPPLLGWAAASGQVSMNAMILPAALYFWQLPHFMALAYLCRKDYADGGFKMFSLFDPSGRRTALVALRNCLYLLPLGYLAYDWGITSWWFCLESTLLALAISLTAAAFYLNRTTNSARTMFHASLLYLPVFMSGLLFHRVADSDQCLTIEDSHMFKELSSSKENTMLQKNSDQCSTLEDSRMFKEVSSSNENPMLHKKPTHKSTGNQVRPPVAYASIPPFPFLPAPSYLPATSYQ